MTIVELYSTLVASGNSNRCNDLRSTLRSKLIISDEITGLSKIEIFKYQKRKYPKEFRLIATEVKDAVVPLFTDIDSAYIKGGNSKIDEFRKLLEKSMINGFWFGSMPTVAS